MKPWLSLLVVCFAVSVILARSAAAQLASELPPILYSTTEPHDPVTELRKQIESGAVTLEKDARYGYLVAILEHLKVPVQSQTLVFSKTSMQRHHISPANPRAIYFNDETYVGWIPGGELIEIATMDANLGAVFYTVDQQRPVDLQRRTERCLFCHASSETGRVPGLLMQSVFTDKDGNRTFPTGSVWPKANGPLATRWAGWFVTGTHGSQTHLGNVMLSSRDSLSNSAITNGVLASDASASTTTGNQLSLSAWLDTSRYLSPHSDLVALLVLQHQVTLHNLLTDTNHRARKLLLDEQQLRIEQHTIEEGRDAASASTSAETRIMLDQLAERLVDGLLMVDAVQFTEAVAGTSGFAAEFSQRGPRDSQGRSLRTLDLTHTLFEYPCSYLIYSGSLDELPQPVRERVSHRINAVLDASDKRAKYEHLTPSKREAIRQILNETKPGFL